MASDHAQEDRHVERRVQDGHGVGADGVEGGVAELEQAGVADDDVQAQAEQDVDADQPEHRAQVVVERQRQQQTARTSSDATSQIGHGDAPEAASASCSCSSLRHSFSATRSPSRPVGRTIRMRASST